MEQFKNETNKPKNKIPFEGTQATLSEEGAFSYEIPPSQCFPPEDQAHEMYSILESLTDEYGTYLYHLGARIRNPFVKDVLRESFKNYNGTLTQKQYEHVLIFLKKYADEVADLNEFCEQYGRAEIMEEVVSNLIKKNSFVKKLMDGRDKGWILSSRQMAVIKKEITKTMTGKEQ